MKLTTAIILLNLSFQAFAKSKLFIFVGPSGVGKTTLIQKLQDSGMQIDYVITTTTRAKRACETEGKDYFFISKDEFAQKKENDELLVTTQIYGNFYGIYKKYIEEKLQLNRNLISCVTADAAQELKDNFSNQVITIFIAPPSIDELKKRLLQRNSETEEKFNMRLASAHREMQQQDVFDYKIINDDLDHAVHDLTEIILKEAK
jgi:guanylate kinase